MDIEAQPHIKLRPEHAREIALVVGDPARAEAFAKQADSHKELAYNREYRSFHVTFKGTEFLIVSHGVGAPGAAICFNELAKIGVKTLIRAGTAGSLQPDVKQGDVVIIQAAAKEDGFSQYSEPLGMPAIGTFEVIDCLRKNADAMGLNVKVGTAVTSDVFYAPKVSASTLEMWSKCKVDIVEMEVSALYVVCRHNGLRCGALVAIDGSPLKWDQNDYDNESDKLANAKAQMAKICFNAIVELSSNAKKSQ